MTEFVTRAGIEADPQLAAFIETDVLGPLGAPPDEGEAVAVEHHHADTGTVGEIFETGHVEPLNH